MTECAECGDEHKIVANMLCRRCYGKQYRADNRTKLLAKHKLYNAEHRYDNRRYRADHVVDNRAYQARHRANSGGKTMDANRECSLFLGTHVAERVLSEVFKNVQKMPINNPGYDFICNQGMKIDVKSSTAHDGRRWMFGINRNTIADYFLCIAFDNRDDLTPLHLWLIPGNDVNEKSGISIAKNTTYKWDEYRIDITDTISCCNKLKNGGLKQDD